MRIIRILAALSAVAWTVATVRVWQDAHNPATTSLCVLIAACFATYTLTQPRKESRNEPHTNRGRTPR